MNLPLKLMLLSLILVSQVQADTHIGPNVRVLNLQDKHDSRIVELDMGTVDPSGAFYEYSIIRLKKPSGLEARNSVKAEVVDGFGANCSVLAISGNKHSSYADVLISFEIDVDDGPLISCHLDLTFENLTF